MATESLITWQAPEHYHVEKNSDWYWAMGIITLALAAVCIILGQVMPAVFVVIAASALIIHHSRPAEIVNHEINDRGIVIDNILYPFLSLESFCIPHNESPSRILIKSRKLFMPFIVVYIDEVDPEQVREILLNYIAETELHEPFLKKIIERLGI